MPIFIIQQKENCSGCIARCYLSFFNSGQQRLFLHPKDKKTNEKLLKSKNPFSKNCLKHPYYHRVEEEEEERERERERD